MFQIVMQSEYEYIKYSHLVKTPFQTSSAILDFTSVFDGDQWGGRDGDREVVWKINY